MQSMNLLVQVKQYTLNKVGVGTMNSKCIKVALLSFWHVHAKDYANQAINHPDVELVAIWDEDKQRGQAEADARNIPFVDELDEIWANSEIQGVIVTTATSQRLPIMLAAAQAKKHVFTEKVIASTSQQCEQIVEAMQEAGVVFTVSLPRLSMPFLLGIKQQLPLLGKLTRVRATLAHYGALPTEAAPNGYLPPQFFNKQEAEGGVLIDLGCHPMYVVRELLGMPQSVYASFGYMSGKEVEDNAVVTLSYPTGAIGIVEAGFVNQATPFTVEVHGQNGSVVYSAIDNKLKLRSFLNPELDTKTWYEQELPAALPIPFDQWVSHIQQKKQHDDNILVAQDLTTLVEAAILSHKEKKAILL